MVITPAILGGNGCEPLTAAIAARQTATGTASVTITFSSAPANNDKILFQCGAF
jgi:hypothetical protein